MMEKEIATPDDIYEAMMHSKHLADREGFSQSAVLKIQLATEEACMNAYEHIQNRQDPSFRVKWTATRFYLEIAVRQPGPVFSLSQSSGTLTGKRGRGILLILNIMEFVEVRESDGTIEFVMRKNKGA